MKPDERPIWYDVYKKFPPLIEPKFSQPQPTNPIKPIFYEEDILRAWVKAPIYLSYQIPTIMVYGVKMVLVLLIILFLGSFFKVRKKQTS